MVQDALPTECLPRRVSKAFGRLYSNLFESMNGRHACILEQQVPKKASCFVVGLHRHRAGYRNRSGDYHLEKPGNGFYT